MPLHPVTAPSAEPALDPAAAPVPGSVPGSASVSTAAAVLARHRAAAGRAWERWQGEVIFPYQAAVLRIGFALVFAAFLLREWPHRLVLYGPRSAWSGPMERQFLVSDHAFTLLAWSDSRLWFELVYALAIAVSLALALGWRTRAMSVLFMVAVLSVQNRAVLVGDGGDNVLHIMAIYLAFTRCGQVWSLDSRRRARREPDAPGATADRPGMLLWALLGAALLLAQCTGFATPGMLTASGWGTVLWAFWALAAVRRLAARRSAVLDDLLDRLGNLLHGCALLVIAAETCLIYATAGWYKVQGDLWQHGTALYYPLHLGYFMPWPALSQALAAHPVPVFLLSYGTVVVQVGFPFLVFHRRIKNLLLVLLVLEHLGIAVLLGLPFFSAAMVAADLVFLPTWLLLRLDARIARIGRRRDRPGRPARAPADRPPLDTLTA